MKISCIKYNQTHSEVFDINEISLVDFEFKQEYTYWVDFEAKPELDILSIIFAKLSCENIIPSHKLFVPESSSFIDHKDWISVSIKMMEYNKQLNKIKYETVLLLLVKNVVFTIQDEVEGDLFGELRDKITSLQSTINHRNAEYLFVRILDSIEKNYHSIIDDINSELVDIDGFISKANSLNEFRILFKLKRELLFLRKNASPLREIINQMINNEEYEFERTNIKLLKNVFERLQFVIDNIDLNREMLSGILDFHISSNGYKMNNIMKVLTIISTIFMPLGFVVGYFGMNFDNLPLLKNQYGYLVVTGFMFLLGIGMLLFFNKRKWL
jgi:magnesium transporter